MRTEASSIMLGFQETMNAFLQTQREVMEAYLAPGSAGMDPTSSYTLSPNGFEAIADGPPDPGPWAGEV